MLRDPPLDFLFQTNHYVCPRCSSHFEPACAAMVAVLVLTSALGSSMQLGLMMIAFRMPLGFRSCSSSFKQVNSQPRGTNFTCSNRSTKSSPFSPKYQASERPQLRRCEWMKTTLSNQVSRMQCTSARAKLVLPTFCPLQ